MDLWSNNILFCKTESQQVQPNPILCIADVKFVEDLPLTSIAKSFFFDFTDF